MYTPSHFLLDIDAARGVIDTVGVATLVADDPKTGYDATMLPMLLRGDRLIGHVAKANPIWRRDGDVLAIFNQVDGYVSPSWYASKREHGKVVPTWNYVTVHVHGQLSVKHDPEWKRALVTSLTVLHEERIGSDWQVTDVPGDFVDAMLNGIVGLEIVITRIEGKAKLSQNRPEADIEGVIAANANALGRAMRERERRPS